MTEDNQFDRRTVLKAGISALPVGAIAGCLGGEQANSGGTTTTEATTSEATPSETTTTETTTETATTETTTETATTETTTETTTSETTTDFDATVAVGPRGNITFAPAEVIVPPGTTVTWEWESGDHNVVVERQPDGANWAGTDGGPSETYGEDHTMSHTFETVGTYAYYCHPHESLGMDGTVDVSESVDAPVAVGETTTAGAADLPIEVGPGGAFEFSPGTDEPVTVEPGTEVEFVWRSDGHNVVVDDQPDGADWTGTPGAPDEVHDEGYTYSHTFETTGEYEFHCAPHEAVGMVGEIVVEDG